MSRKLSTAEVSRLLGMAETDVRRLVRSGLCRPARRGRRYAFDFQDLVVLYAARSLMDAEVPKARIHRALAALVEQLPEGEPLSSVRIRPDGRQVTVSDGVTTWNPDTGQAVFNFESQEMTRLAEDYQATLEHRPVDAASDARREFERALELEDDDSDAAQGAYRRALELDPDLVDAHVNLGRLLHEADDPQGAIELYREALTRTPDDPVVHFNMGLALEDTGEEPAALTAYEQALDLDPEFADAHFNMASLLEHLGRVSDAVRHYREYKRLTTPG